MSTPHLGFPISEESLRNAQLPRIRDAITEKAYKMRLFLKVFLAVVYLAEDEQLRHARLQLVAALRDLILRIADISEIVADERAG